MFLKKLDTWITRAYVSIPLFFIILFFMFQVTFLLGGYLSSLLDTFANKFYHILNIHNIIIDAIFGGVVGVLVFIPNLFILYIFLFFLNESGILPRISFVFDKALRKIGLSSKSLLSVSLGFGCTVSAILSTRSITNQREKIMTIFMLPFVSCSAKISVFTFLISIFVQEKYQSLTLLGCIFFGILLGGISTAIMHFFAPNNASSFRVNIPRYTVPSFKKIIIKTCQLLKEFIFKIGALTIPISLILSIAFSFPQNVDIKDTYGSKAGAYIHTLFEPLGFNREMSISIVGGLAGKEMTISTLASLYYIQQKDASGLKEKLLHDQSISFASIISFLIFLLLYTPCMSAVITAKNELGYRYGILFFIYPIVIAWLSSYVMYFLLK